MTTEQEQQVDVRGDPRVEPGDARDGVCNRGDPADSFGAAMMAFAPFEPEPHLAVAVSGGADSTALVLLAVDWAARRGGHVTALTVDHGLRPDSRDEALSVGRRLAARGIAHRILRWRDDSGRGRANLQARARDARYRLLEDWCRRHSVLHLLTGHHAADQAETFLLRLGRGSGVHGLAGMAAVAERDAVRVLRPLLGVAPEALRVWLRSIGEAWIEDPSNMNPAFARARLRGLLPGLAAEGLDAARILKTTIRLGRDRRAAEDAVARLLAGAAAPYPAGFVRLRIGAFAAAPDAVAARALARVITCVGGGIYPPRSERLARLLAELRAARRSGLRGRTLGGCLVRPEGNGDLLVTREAAAQAAPIVIDRAGTRDWDGRFRVRIVGRLRRAAGGAGAGPVTLGPLGPEGWRTVRRLHPAAAAHAIPACVRPTLPALRDALGPIDVPHLRYRRPGDDPYTFAIAEVRPFPAGGGLTDSGFGTAPVALVTGMAPHYL